MAAGEINFSGLNSALQSWQEHPPVTNPLGSALAGYNAQQTAMQDQKFKQGQIDAQPGALQAQTLGNSKSSNELIANVAFGVTQTDPEKQSDAYQQGLQILQNQGVDLKGVPPTWDQGGKELTQQYAQQSPFYAAKLKSQQAALDTQIKLATLQNAQNKTAVLAQGGANRATGSGLDATVFDPYIQAAPAIKQANAAAGTTGSTSAVPGSGAAPGTSSGGSGSQPLTTTTRTQLQEKLVADKNTDYLFNKVTTEYSDKYLTYSGKAQYQVAIQADKVGVASEAQKKLVAGKATFDKTTTQLLQAYEKSLYGSRVPVQGFSQVKAAMVNTDLSPTQFKAVMKSAKENFEYGMHLKEQLLSQGFKENTPEFNKQFDAYYTPGQGAAASVTQYHTANGQLVSVDDINATAKARGLEPADVIAKLKLLALPGGDASPKTQASSQQGLGAQILQ